MLHNGAVIASSCLPTVATSLLRIDAAADQAPLSAQQQLFNAWVQRIADQRAWLLAWDEAVQACRSRFARDGVPLRTRYLDLQAALALYLDQQSARKLSKLERQLLESCLLESAQQVADLSDSTCTACRHGRAGTPLHPWKRTRSPKTMRRRLRRALRRQPVPVTTLTGKTQRPSRSSWKPKSKPQPHRPSEPVRSTTPSASNAKRSKPKKPRGQRRLNWPTSHCGRCTAVWPAACTPIGSKTRWSARAKRR